jgi:hypothetical protein
MEKSRSPTRRLFHRCSPSLAAVQFPAFGPSCRCSSQRRSDQRCKRVDASNDGTCSHILQFTRASLSYNKLYSHMIYRAAAVTDHALPLPRRESDLPPAVFIFCASPTSSPMSLLYVSESCCSASFVWSRWVNSADVFCVCICSSDK